MRTASDALKAMLAAGQFFRADLYEFTLITGQTLYYTSFDQDITADGNTYVSGLGWARTQWKLSVGLAVDTMDVTLQAAPTDLLPGTTTPVIETIAAGYWDGAPVKVKRAHMATPSSPAETVLIFTGWVGDITEIGRIHCTMQLQSKLALLNVGMPKGLFQPSCRHVFGSPACGVDRAALVQIGTVGSGSTPGTIQTGIGQPGPVPGPTSSPSLSSTTDSSVNLPANITYWVVTTYISTIGETTPSPEAYLLIAPHNGVLHVASPPSAPNVTGWNVYVGVEPGDEQLQNSSPLSIGSNYTMAQNGIYLSGIRPPTSGSNGFFSLGSLTMTSGANAGLSRVIESSSADGSASLRIPFFSAVEVGDTLKIVPGCPHTLTACRDQFNNIEHFGGFPYIPTPEIGSA